MHDEDRIQFERLVSSAIRSDDREQAMAEWQRYKLHRQALYQQGRLSSGSGGKSGVWTKGDYIKSLTAPAIDLRRLHIRDVCLGYVDLRGVRLDDSVFGCDSLPWVALKGAKLEQASLRGCRWQAARLLNADLRGADLSGADFADADFSGANLQGACLHRANLTGADLQRANLVGADVSDCCLDGARVYGVAAWDLVGEPRSSRDLIVTPTGMPTITIDDMRVAQFIYLLLNNPEIRNVLDTVTQKVVLLLGRFKPERKQILDALKSSLRQQDLVPVLFDFGRAADRDITETVTLLARMAHFIVADLSEPSSIPQELQAVVPDVAVPVRLIIEEGMQPYSMVTDLYKYPWVIRPLAYKGLDDLLDSLETQVIEVARGKSRELARQKLEDGG